MPTREELKEEVVTVPKTILMNIYDDHNINEHGVMIIHFLYKLLEERMATPDVNISHKEMPRYKDHVKFVENQPYREWFVLWSKEFKCLVGSLYLTQNNEVGIHLTKEYQDHGLGSDALKQLLERHKNEDIYANINPKNEKSMSFFRKHGFEAFTHGLVQNVYIRPRSRGDA